MIDKPSGPTSHDVVDMVRRTYGVRRVGHAGTLDPFATGLIIVLVGRATRLARFVAALPKRYTGLIRLGVTTDTDDRSGAVIATDDGWSTVSSGALATQMAALTGRQRQRPPDYSAKKTRGERAHRRARRGEPVELTPQEVEVAELQVTGRDGPAVRFRATVSSGTYIRALARDLGESLGCGAHLEELRRIAVGSFGVDEALPVSALDRGFPTLLPLHRAIAHLPTIELSPEAREAVRSGRPIPAEGASTGPVALVSDHQLIAVAEPSGAWLKPRVVLVGN